MNSDCEIKIEDLQRYVPFLENLVETLREDSTKEAKLREMQLLHKLLTKPDAGVTLDKLLKCEEVLNKVFKNTQKNEASSPCCEDFVKEDISESLNGIFNKMDKDDADEAVSEKGSKVALEVTSEQSCKNKTEKETNSNNPESNVEKSEQNKDENLQEEDQNKDESFLEDIEEKEVSDEDNSDQQDDSPKNSLESQKALLNEDQSEKVVSEKVDSEVTSTDDIVQGKNHEQDTIEDKKKDREICETERLEEPENIIEEIQQKAENEATSTNEKIQGQKNEQDVIEENKKEKKMEPDELLEEEENKKDGTPSKEQAIDEELEEKENINEGNSSRAVETEEELQNKEKKKKGILSKSEATNEEMEKKENKKEETSSRMEATDEELEMKENKKDGTPARVEGKQEELEKNDTKKEISLSSTEATDEELEEKENEKEGTSSRVESTDEELEEIQNEKDGTSSRVGLTDEKLEDKQNKQGGLSSKMESTDKEVEAEENEKEGTSSKVEATHEEEFEEKANEKEATSSKVESTDEALVEKENKKEGTSSKVKSIDEELQEKENKQEGPSSKMESTDKKLETKENEKEGTPSRVEETDEDLEEKENEKEGISSKVGSTGEEFEKKENEKDGSPSRVEATDEDLEKKENEKEGIIPSEATLPVKQTTAEVEEKEESKENGAEETNDEVQIVQTSPIDSEKSKNCDENKVNIEKDKSTAKQSKEEQDKNVDVPEKFTETIKTQVKNDLELESVEKVEVVDGVKNKKQTSSNKVAALPESTSKRLLPKRPKPIDSNSTVKAIELKPKDPSEKSAVVYLVKKGAPKPVETIELLDSDSEDDDVILVSEVGLKKKIPAHKTAAKRMMPANKTPQIPAKVPSVIRQSTQGNKLMFAITSVQSIGQQEQQKRQQQQHTQLAQMQRNKNLIISPTKVRTQGIYSPGTITFHKVKQSQPASVPQRTYIGVKQTPLIANKFVSRLNSQIVISSVGSTAGTSNAKPTLGIVKRSNTQNNQMERVEGPAIDFANRSAQEEESPWNPDKDCQRSKDWLENFLSNVLSPTQNVTTFGVDLLQRSLDISVFARIRTIMEENKKVFVSTLDKDVKVMHKNSDEIMALFFRDGSLTDAGVKLASFAKQAMSRVFTTDRRTGHITSKSRKRPKELDDDEYSPSVIVEFAQETVANRRRSLRRESKANRKQYFAYEDDDDAEFLEMVEEQARIEANNRANKIHKINKKPVPRRSNGSSSSSEPPSVKKMRLEEGTSVETPFETDLLKPTWVEDAVGEAYQDQFNEGADEPEDEPEEQDGGAVYPFPEEEEEQNNQKQTDPLPEGKMNVWKMSRLGRYHSKWKNFKNINRAHHCRSTFIDSCILCNVKHNFVVAHYVNHHRETEVLIARLTQRDIDQLVRSVNYGYLTASRSTAHQYSATCVFCKREMTFALRYWWEHYSMHTGEYGYECTKCFLRRPRRQHAQKHANNECHLGLAKVRIIYDFDKTMNQIEAYICKLCNYIQIHKENVVKHLNKQHEIQVDVQTNIIRVVLLQIARPYNEDIPGQESQNNSNSFDYYESFNGGGMSIGADNSYPGYDLNDESDVTYMQYSGGMMGHDDLSFMICDMLATDDPTQQLPPSTSFTFDTPSSLRKDGGGAQ